MHRTRPLAFALGLLLLAAPAFAPVFAQQARTAAPVPAASLPAWEQLSTADREALIAPLRDRWNGGDVANRQRMLEHARRWKAMTPEQRRAARKGMHRWEHLSPDQREQARALFERMRTMDPAQRRALHDQWRAMTPQQRKAWIDQHPPQDTRGDHPH